MERLELKTIENIIKKHKTVVEVLENEDIDDDYDLSLDKCIIRGMEELKQYRIAEEQGFLLRLPCKVGSTIYKVYQQPTKCTARGFYKDAVICYGCDELECDSSYVWAIYQCEADVKELVCVIDKIGKTVFLTKEEAEAALEKMKGIK